jgi:formylglycine-generating enzyme required for sulfatase activity
VVVVGSWVSLKFAHAAMVAELSTNKEGMTFVEIPPTPSEGFQMGSPESEADRNADEVLHTVHLKRGFMMGTYDVTRGQFAQFVAETKYRPEGDGDEHNWRNPGFRVKQTENDPVVYVTWNDANRFCQWLRDKDGRHYRLPTEAEWEYACRAGSKSAYFWGDDSSKVGDYAWYDHNAHDGTQPVGGKSPNAWKLYDMCGNVWQRCEDRYGDYAEGSVTDPTGTASGDSHVSRGGGWCNPANYFRCANRGKDLPEVRNDHLGFRVCVDFPE